jgi:hypothetical protein
VKLIKIFDSNHNLCHYHENEREREKKKGFDQFYNNFIPSALQLYNVININPYGLKLTIIYKYIVFIELGYHKTYSRYVIPITIKL